MSVAGPDKTAALVAEAQLGLAASFDALAEQQRGALWAVAYRWFGDRETALDCVQETLLRAYQSLPRFRGECAFSTWLLRILEHVCLEEQRRLAKWGRSSELVDLAHELGVEERLSARGDLWAALEAFAQLPLDFRTTTLLSVVEGYSHAETSAILGITVAATKMRVRRARALMSCVRSPEEGAAVGDALSDAYRHIGGLLLAQGKIKESDQALLAAVRWAPPTAYRVWQQYQERRGTPVHYAALAQAIRVLTKAVEGPQPAAARVALANLRQWGMHDPAGAERDYTGYLQDTTFVGDVANVGLAHRYAFSGRPRRAAALLRDHLRRYGPPPSQYSVVLLARCLALCREPTARRWAERARSVAMEGWAEAESPRVYQLQTANLRAVASDAYWLLGDRASSRRLSVAARQVLPKDVDVASLHLVR